LVARAAPALQPVTATLPDSPWKPFRAQVAWLLLLLATKSPDTRALLGRLQRTMLAPLAAQLESAERFFAEAAAPDAAAVIAAAAAAAASVPLQPPQPPQPPQHMHAPALQSSAALTSSSSAGVPAKSVVPTQQLDSVAEDELLQAEVAFLSLSSGRGGGPQ
jgi:hypothetical protein